MATNTYTALATQTLGTAASSVTFSSIPQGYTDLVMVVSASQTGGSVNQGKLAVGNGSIDTGSNYSETILYGNGSSALSARTNGTWWNADYLAAPPLSGIPNACIYHFQNYSNTTTYKTVLSRSNVAGNGLEAMVHLWRSTAAINTILYGVTGGSLAAGTTISIYGIAAQTVATSAKATGGTITYDAYGYVYHTFTGNGTFTPSTNLTADVLCVAGGAAGGISYGGGGGAGGVIYFTNQSLTSGAGSTIVVGAGGTGLVSGTQTGNNGNDSYFASLTHAVGGGGGSGTGSSTGGSNGGSGGGGSRGTTGVQGGGASTQTGTGATAFYGNAGGSGGSSSTCSGGGGAGAPGTAGSGTTGGNGGNGTTAFSSWGAVTGTGQNVSGVYYYAGGGSGNGTGAWGVAGYGGGGGGGATGAANTGGGGCDGNTNGGSGIVIVRYYGA